MDMKDTHEEMEQGGTVSPKKMARRKKGRNYLIAAIVLLAISYGMYAADIGGIIAALVSTSMLVLFVGGLGYLIIGFIGRD